MFERTNRIERVLFVFKNSTHEPNVHSDSVRLKRVPIILKNHVPNGNHVQNQSNVRTNELNRTRPIRFKNSTHEPNVSSDSVRIASTNQILAAVVKLYMSHFLALNTVVFYNYR